MPVNSAKRAVIFANGELKDPESIRKSIRPDDWIVAADGGTLNALACGKTPDLVIGDLDSLPLELKSELENTGTEFIVHPAEKNETDLELALLHVAKSRVQAVLVLGALGGRLDQMLANIHLLALPELEGMVVELVDANQAAYITRDMIEIHGKPGDRVSVIPLGGDAYGVSTVGLEWPLKNETLSYCRARGVSNVLTGTDAWVKVSQGVLLVVMVDNVEFGE